ncbi:alkaline phosphatase family protein [Caulobacter henricii]|uniref:Alkaline phosphatase n=1 Tax=Caulobacter henricii TaxID=69395 RepID=A0A0N7JHL3_9CAUL|nr:alkaline phosphatase family protein [Caulobacter henricii]ALL13714.1 alkaline phosphatase [Caulobacter henricii]
MKKKLTSGALVCAVLVSGALTQAEAQPQALAKPDPRLVVVISIDQFSANLFAQYRGTFSGGLGRLAREGVVYPNGYQSHAMTETCPGHSTLLTGKHPNKTGISANDWYDASLGKQVYCLADDSVVLAHDPKGRPVSPKNMVATTYGDWLKAVSPNSRVFGVSGKDRGAITLSGHQADGAFWLQPGFGFTTYVPPGQTAEARLKPVAAFNARMLADLKKHPFVWDYAKSPMDALLGGSAKRCRALEADYETGGRKWRAALPIPTATSEADRLRDLGGSPFTDQVTLDLAAQLRDDFGLGDGPQVDVLAVSLSATDFIGHRFGTRGPEMCDQIARLDEGLGEFLDRVGKAKGGVLVVLSADHGGADMPERLHEEGYEAGRIGTKAWLAALNATLRKDLGLAFDPLVADGGINTIDVVGPDRKALDPVEHVRITAAALALVSRQPEVVEAFDVNTLLTLAPEAADTSPEEISLRERMRRSAYPGRMGDIVVAFRPELVPATAGPTYVSTHGSPWDYDRRVPIIFWWKGGAPRERVLPLDTVDIAPTLAAVTGLKPPADVDGRCRPLGAGHDC